jgi:hypothetical protein
MRIKKSRFQRLITISFHPPTPPDGSYRNRENNGNQIAKAAQKTQEYLKDSE